MPAKGNRKTRRENQKVKVTWGHFFCPTSIPPKRITLLPLPPKTFFRVFTAEWSLRAIFLFFTSAEEKGDVSVKLREIIKAALTKALKA